MESVLKIENLKYKNILNDITLSLEDKSFNILVGKSRSGKTALVNCIRGLLNYEGNINLFNNVLTKDNYELYRNVGFFIEDDIILEDYVYNELLNTLMNLDYEENKAKQRIFTIAKKLDVEDLLFKRENELLVYEKKLIIFMLSIIHEPKLLIIDNELEVFDKKNKDKILKYLKSQKKLAVLFITNNSEYFELADKLFFLNDGKIVLSGTLEEVIENEKTFIKCGSSLPFATLLSNKLISYDLLKEKENDIEKMVNKIWK